MPSFSSLITLCFLSAFCSLPVRSAPSTTGHTVELSARQAQAPNPFGLGFPPGSAAVVTAVSHSSFTQRLVVAGPPALCTLQGSGENIDMTDPASPTVPTQCVFEPATTADFLNLDLLFQFSSTGPNGVFNNTSIVTTSTHAFQDFVSILATSEDSTDNDDNDTEATITAFLFPDSTSSAQSTVSTFEHSLIDSGILVNPTDSITVSVGPFAGDSTLSDFQATTQDWNTVTGEIIDVHQDAPFSNVLLMRFLFSDSTNDEQKNSALLLNGVMTYTGARPTGTLTRVNWYSKSVGVI